MGIRPTSPGWKTWVIKPAPGSLKNASIILPTPHGPITAVLTTTTNARGDSTSSLHENLDILTTRYIRLQIPSGTSATVCLPVGQITKVDNNLRDVLVNGVFHPAHRKGSYICVDQVTDKAINGWVEVITEFY